MNISRAIELKSNEGHLLLRPYEFDDAATIYEAVNVSREELAPWMDWCTPEYTIRDTKKWLEGLPAAWERGELFGFGIFDGTTGQFLGGCGLNRILWGYRMANLTYWVRFLTSIGCIR
ncbi:MAG: GNAT family N-acetyltransferase [Chloroflexota bacterium]|jgi:RimJ/RimL family protein N-acetyltransferase